MSSETPLGCGHLFSAVDPVMRHIFSVFCLLVWAHPVFAQSPGELRAVREAFAEIADADWSAAAAAVEGHPVAETLVTWRRLREGGASLRQISRFMADYPDWPGLRRMRRAGEQVMTDQTPPGAILNYFADHPPQTGAGARRLATALRTTGDPEAADALLISTWTTKRLSDRETNRYLRDHSALLTPHHAARIDMLLWQGSFTAAERLLPLVDENQQALARARIGLRRDAPGVDILIARVPEKLRTHPGLAYERFEWRARRGRTDPALELILGNSTSAQALGNAAAWSNRRRVMARQQMREGDPTVAYYLAATHHLSSGAAFADLEWLAGYVALTKLDQPEKALAHFARMRAAVSSPISLGRAGYWLGRAHEALGDEDAAAEAYAFGAQHQTSFYGLLAAERAGFPMDPDLVGSDPEPAWEDAGFVDSDVFQAAQLLIAVGYRDMAELFVTHLTEGLDYDGLAQLAAYLREVDEPHLAVMAGKRAARNGVVVADAYFPLHPLAERNMAVPPELALAIARRESEFDPVVTSPVGARGLMQVMPRTARALAGRLDLDYSGERLYEPSYNVRLGIAYLEELQERFGPSYVMIAAAYNAGPSRPIRWMEEQGDPRAGERDIVDWIEHIQFRETRNYVMRVMESMVVYRARLTGEVAPLRFTSLLVGEVPLRRPQLRPEGLGQPSPEPAVLATE